MNLEVGVQPADFWRRNDDLVRARLNVSLRDHARTCPARLRHLVWCRTNLEERMPRRALAFATRRVMQGNPAFEL